MVYARRIRIGLKTKPLLRRCLLAAATLMSFRTFQYFPGMQYVQELWFVLCLVSLVLVYLAWKYSTGLRFTYFEIYLLALLIVDIVLPAWAAAREFGQPLYYGLLAQRHALLIAAAVLVFLAMRSQRLSQQDIRAALLGLAWGTWGLYSLMRLFLNPERYTSYGVGFVSGLQGQTAFILHGDFITFGVVYYALLGLRRQHTRYYVIATVLSGSRLGRKRASISDQSWRYVLILSISLANAEPVITDAWQG
jgi:hypothetical protein